MLQTIGSMLINGMLDRINTEDDYRQALKRFIEICGSQKNSDELDEMLVIMDLMEKYERENCSQN